MSAEWSYAQLSKIASSVGGPEKLMEIIKNQAFQEGFKEGLKKGKIQMLPYVVAALSIGIGGTIAFNKWNESRKRKTTALHISADKARVAEELLIQKIKEVYNEEDNQADEGPDTDKPEDK